MTGKRRTKAAIAAAEICNSLSSILETGVDQFRGWWSERRISNCHQFEDEVSTFVGPRLPVIDRHWTTKDEAWLMRTWENSSAKLALGRIDKPPQELLKLWRLSCTLMRCSPLAIVSPRYGLIYDGVETPLAFSSQNHGERSLWSDGFCKALCALVVHSFWRGNAKLLATSIQFAVICRTDDRQPWRMAMSPSSCQAMETLRDIAAAPRLKHIHHMQSEFTATQAASGTETSLEYEFLCHLGSIIDKPLMSYAEEQSDAHPHIYAVRTADLDTILLALNTFNAKGFPLFTHSDIFLNACKSAPLHYAFPKGDKLCELHMLSFLHETRMAYRQVRADEWTPRTPRVFLPGAASFGAGPAAKPMRSGNGRGFISEVITISDDDEKPRLGLRQLKGCQRQGQNHHQHHAGGKSQKKQQQQQQHQRHQQRQRHEQHQRHEQQHKIKKQKKKRNQKSNCHEQSLSEVYL